MLVGKPTTWFSPTSSNLSSFRWPISGGNSVILLPCKYRFSSLIKFCMLVGKPTNWFSPTFRNLSTFRTPISGGNSVISLPYKYSTSSLFSFCILVGKLISLLSFTESTTSSLRSLITAGSSFSLLPSKCSSSRFFRFCILEGKSTNWFLLRPCALISVTTNSWIGRLSSSVKALDLINPLLTLSTLSSFKSPISSGRFFSPL